MEKLEVYGKTGSIYQKSHGVGTKTVLHLIEYQYFRKFKITLTSDYVRCLPHRHLLNLKETRDFEIGIFSFMSYSTVEFGNTDRQIFRKIYLASAVFSALIKSDDKHNFDLYF